MRQQLADMKYGQRGSETVVTEAKRELAMVEAQAAVPPPAQAGLDRAPDRTQVSITTNADVAIAQLEDAIRPLLAWADARSQVIALEAPLGARVSSKWVLQFKENCARPRAAQTTLLSSSAVPADGAMSWCSSRRAGRSASTSARTTN